MIPMNHVTLAGRLAADAELRYTQTGKSVARFRVCVNEKISPDREITEYITVQSWRNAEEIGALMKGDKVHVEGRFKTDSYEKNGQKVYTSYVLATSVTVPIAGKPVEGNYDAFTASPGNEEIPF